MWFIDYGQFRSEYSASKRSMKWDVIPGSINDTNPGKAKGIYAGSASNTSDRKFNMHLTLVLLYMAIKEDRSQMYTRMETLPMLITKIKL